MLPYNPWTSKPVTLNTGEESEAFMINRSEEHTSELQSRSDLVCRLLLEKKREQVRTPATHRSRMPSPARNSYWTVDYQITFAPSARVLSRCIERHREHTGPVGILFAVQN